MAKYCFMGILLIIASFYLVSNYSKKQEKISYIENINSYKKANLIITENFKLFCCRSMNKYYFETSILPKSYIERVFFNDIEQLWDRNLLDKGILGGIETEQDSTIRYQIKSYYGGLFTPSYSHEIIFDPHDKYSQKTISDYSKIISCNQIESNWKYIIFKNTFD